MTQVQSNTWEIVERQTNRKVIGNRMVLRTKKRWHFYGQEKGTFSSKGLRAV